MPGPQKAWISFPLEHEAPSRKFDTEAALDEQEGGCPLFSRLPCFTVITGRVDAPDTYSHVMPT